MPRVVMIIQVRMGSKRLPGKSLMKLAGKPMIACILERVKRCKEINDIVLAIPNTLADGVLAEIAEEYNVSSFKGAEENLLDRYLKAAEWAEADVVVRFPADNATPEPKEIDRIVAHHLSKINRGFSSNLAEIWGSGYPDGIGAEVFDFSTIVEAIKRNPTAEMLEHIHLNFYNYSTGKPVDPEWCPVSTIQCPADVCRPDIVLDVNTKEQYEFMLQLYDYLYPRNPYFCIRDIIDWYDGVYKKNNIAYGN